MFFRPLRRTAVAALLTWFVVSSLVMIACQPPALTDSGHRPSVPAELTINSPEDMTYENGTLGKTIKWTPADPSPKNYSVSRNGTEFLSGTWSGIAITVALNHLYAQHRVTVLPINFVFACTVFNRQNESISDTVVLHIIPDETPPIIVAPDNFSYEAGSFGHRIIWNITESNPDFYNVTRVSNETSSNSSVVVSGPWDGRNITVSVDGLNATRWYAYTLFVNDTLGHNSTSTVNITVYADLTPPTATAPDDISYEYGSKGHHLTWVIYDSNPKNYTLRVYVLDMISSYGNTTSPLFHPPANITVTSWVLPANYPKGMPLNIALDYLYLGNYTYTLTLFDDFGRNATDSVSVVVYRDLRAPVVNATSDYAYEEGYKGHEINWTIEESNPRSYNLTRNNATLQGGAWRGQNFTIVVDGLAVGEYTFNMTLVDFFNQSTSSIVIVTVTPDAHAPSVAHVQVLQAYFDAGLTNVTFQAYAWDINGLHNVTVEWGTDPSNPVSKLMKTISPNLYFAEAGYYPVGTVVWYRIVATDNSSVMNIHTTEWAYFTVASIVGNAEPALLWAVVSVLGVLSVIAFLNIYFRTKTRG